MRKFEELADTNSCLNKATDDEPIFVLRAQDFLAPYAVRQWVLLVESHVMVTGGEIDPELALKLNEADNLADAMEAWPNRKIPD